MYQQQRRVVGLPGTHINRTRDTIKGLFLKITLKNKEKIIPDLDVDTDVA